MTLPDLTQILSTVAVGAAATLITLKVSMARIEARMEASNERVSEGFDGFRREAEGLRVAVGHLTQVVAKQGVMVDGVEDIYNRLRNVETRVAVLEAKEK